ncbi:MAG: SMC-Scp complex subunit ScpB [Bacteroidia bacterium]|nr:SMC-Scp complex subunit ScpB [Bacteroidia bacterium]
MENIAQHIEATIFVSDKSISVKEIIECLKSSLDKTFTEKQLEPHLIQLKNKYSSNEYSFELVEIAEGYQFLTKSEYHDTIKILLQQKARRKLSNSAMETLSIIAYKQPVSKSEVEKIRGVNCDYSVQRLLEKELISILGKSDAPGKPILYGVSNHFLDYFGIKSVSELPQIKDIHEEQNEIGTPAE